jgi:hypothetical protein
MKLVNILEDAPVDMSAKQRLLALQSKFVESYRDDVIDTELGMVDGHPCLTVTVDVGYWKQAINIFYKPYHQASQFWLCKPGFTHATYNVNKVLSFFIDIALEQDSTNFLRAFQKRFHILKFPLNLSATQLLEAELEHGVEVEHITALTLPNRAELDDKPMFKTHKPLQCGFNLSSSGGAVFRDDEPNAYIIWVKR